MRVPISEEAANLAFDLAVQLMDRTRDIAVCMFCDSFENTRGPREHGPKCPVGKFEAFVSPMIGDDAEPDADPPTQMPEPTEGTKGDVILTAIKAVDGPIYYRDLAAQLGFDHGHVAAFLSMLRKRGHVEALGGGQWRAVVTARATAFTEQPGGGVCRCLNDASPIVCDDCPRSA